MKKTICFDFDGTISNPYIRLYKLHSDLLNFFGYTTSITEKKYIFLKRRRVSEENIIKDMLPKGRIKHYIKKRAELIESPSYLKHDFLITGMKTVLKKLSQKNNIILLTSRKKKSNFEQQMDNIGICKYFNRVIVAENGKNAKKNILRKINISAMVGDTEEDIKVAKSLNIPIIFVEWGMRSKRCIKNLKPDYISRNIIELEKTIDEVLKYN